MMRRKAATTAPGLKRRVSAAGSASRARKIAAVHVDPTSGSVIAPVYHLSTLTGVLRVGREMRLPSRWENKAPVVSPYQSFIKKRPSVARALAVLLLIGINVFSFTNVRPTQAYFNDTENTGGNHFSSGKLDIVLSNTEFEGTLSNALGDGSQFTTNVSLVSGSLDTHYRVGVASSTGALCAQLEMHATHATSTYDGALTTFVTDPSTDDFGLWDFFVVLPPEDAPASTSCDFDLTFEAWMLGYETLPESGFYDKETMHVRIFLDPVGTGQSPVVINEFLPNPDGELLDDDGNLIFDFGKDNDDMPQGEWVELYNLTGVPVDLTNWYLTDASGGVGNTSITGANTVPATTTIAANGFLVVYMNKPVWNNTGDTVKLLDGSDLLRDSYAYTKDHDFCELVPTPGDENTEAGSGTECNDNQVPGNKSFARIPDGTGAFVDPIPTPGFENEEGDGLTSDLWDIFMEDIAEEVLPTLPEEASVADAEEGTTTNETSSGSAENSSPTEEGTTTEATQGTSTEETSSDTTDETSSSDEVAPTDTSEPETTDTPAEDKTVDQGVEIARPEERATDDVDAPAEDDSADDEASAPEVETSDNSESSESSPSESSEDPSESSTE